jgi:glyoxylase-like metal-dependent hydrolase (beta-lactamase superfamily II)
MWIHGAADCQANADPLLQVHRFDADTFIMRENKCYSAEGNFMYLLLGMDKALLLDTGDLQDADSLLPRTDLPLTQTVRGILAERQPLEVIVAHTHSHGDHVFWDSEFPPAAVVRHDRKSIMERFGLSDWPDGRPVFDLGGRPLDVFPIPGHEPHHIALYDRNTRILLTGDMLYPGVLTVPVAAWETYRQSAARLADFAAQCRWCWAPTSRQKRRQGNSTIRRRRFSLTSTRCRLASSTCVNCIKPASGSDRCRAATFTTTSSLSHCEEHSCRPPPICRRHLRPERAGRLHRRVRPFRNCSYRLEAETIGSKFIVHNYGYGGAGITLSWGWSPIL